MPVQDDPLGVSFVAHYVVIDTFCMPGVGDASCLMSVYVYPESNNVPGLQRCDEVKCDTQDCEPWQPGPDYDGL